MQTNDFLKIPEYFQRDYENDLPPEKAKETENASQALRVVKVGLPFIALYQPFGRVLACGLGATRTVSTLGGCYHAQDYKQFSWAMFNTCLAIGSIAGTVFLHPLGMLLTTLNDIGMNAFHIYGAISEGDMHNASKQTLRIAGNSLYLGMMVTGSVQLQLAALALQVVVEGSASFEEFNKDNMLEMVGHMGMCMVRANQSYNKFGALQEQWGRYSLSEKTLQRIDAPKSVGLSADSNANSQPKVTPSSKFKFIGVEHEKWHPEIASLKKQHGALMTSYLEENYPQVKSYGDQGDLVAVWVDYLDVDQGFIRGSHFDPTTKTWSDPISLEVGDIDDVNFSFLTLDSMGNATIMFSSEDLLRAATFQSSTGVWTNEVTFKGGFIPFGRTVYGFDVDSMGNCTVAWHVEREDNPLFATAFYNVQTQNWTESCFIYNWKAGLNLADHTSYNAPIVRFNDLGAMSVITRHVDSEYNGKIMNTIWLSEDKQMVLQEQIGDNADVIGSITTGQGDFITVLQESDQDLDQESFYSVHFQAGKGHDLNRTNIHGPMENCMDVTLGKDPSGNPVLVWNEVHPDWVELFSRSDLQDVEDPWEEIDLSNMPKPQRMSAAIFHDQNWEISEIAGGTLFIYPKIVNFQDQLYMVWQEEYYTDQMERQLKLQKSRYDRETGKWSSPEIVLDFPFEGGDFFGNFGAPMSIVDGIINMVWPKGGKYHQIRASL